MPVTLDPPFEPPELTNLLLAEMLARGGVPIFPCDENKKPLTQHGFRDATTNINVVRAMWRKHPDAMPGINLGAAALLAIDADEGRIGIAAFEALCEPHGGVPECPMVDTPAGGGRHFIFRQRPGEKLGNGRGGLPPKAECPVDVRGAGGYIIAPGSVRYGGDFADGIYDIGDGDPLDILQAPELPEWLHDILTGKREDKAPSPAPVDPSPLPKAPSSPLNAASSSQTAVRALDMGHPRLRAWVEKAFDDEIQALTQCGRGGRNNQLNTSAFAIFQFVAAGWVAEDAAHTALVQAAEACGLVKDDGRRSVLKTISSARRGGTAQPREVPEEFIRDEEIAASAVALNRDLAVSADGTLHDATTGEVIDREAVGSTWALPDLTLLNEGRRPPPTFQLDWLGPHLARWAEAQARATSAPTDYAAVSLLGLIGGLLGNRRRPLAGAGWEEPPTLFMALVGEPSSGKSPASSAVMSLVNNEEAALDADYRQRLCEYEAEKLSADAVMAAHKTAAREAMRADPALAAAIPVKLPEGFREPVKPFLKRIVVRDSTVERLATLSAENPAGLVLHRDELAGLFASFGRYSGGGGSDRQFFLEAYGGRSFTVDRVKSGDPIRVPHLSIGIIGALQPDKAAELLKGADDGFVSRFLWCWPNPVPGFHIAREDFDRGPAERVVNRVCRLHMNSNPVPMPDSPVFLRLEEPALAELERFALEMKAREAGASPLMKSALGKARGHALRLSSILTIMWWSADPRASFDEPADIGEAAVATACEMMETYFLPMAERVFGDASIPVAETNAATLARHIRAKMLPTFNVRGLRRQVGGALRTAEAMDAALAELGDAGLVRPIPDTKAGRGRKIKGFEVNPAMCGGDVNSARPFNSGTGAKSK
ncbi:DUF3987 domain-containing protein [Xanthobacter autotrophicus]|uniref:DUF3987 domain-containing protein n=1 Tax=Xanthobacter autotrophicus TaxID=280 RepID=UPI0024A61FC8|nr:DUF3987 domain-containing protein [Xanthobacter autotrophicus]MDI4655550.1 DUF3987 domain-containing protein [Xanthobacter autotrophicus]